MSNSADIYENSPFRMDQTVFSGSALFAQVCLSKDLGYSISPD